MGEMPRDNRDRDALNDREREHKLEK